MRTNCPDPNELIDFHFLGASDRESEEHVRTCPECQADLEMLRALKGALKPDIDVPFELVDRVMTQLPNPQETPKALSRIPGHPVFGGLLGAMTGLAALIATGGIAAGGLVWPVLLVSAIGGISALMQARNWRAVGPLPIGGGLDFSDPGDS